MPKTSATVEPDPATGSSRRRVAAASIVGSMLEWYDFALFGSAAALVFNHVFFSSQSPFAATLSSFATFAVGFAARPVGGLLLAHFVGDRFGRKPALMATIVLMGLGTVAIGVLPTYGQIGIWAPLLLVACRIVQGFGVGAELGGAYIWTTESAKPTLRGFYAALPGAGEFVGLLCASGAMAIVTSLPEREFLSWGWRIPFLASMIGVIVGLILRYTVEESSKFRQVVDAGRREARPLAEVLKHRKKTVLLMIGSGGATAVASFSIASYLPSYTSQQLSLPANVPVIAIAIASAISIFSTPFAGWLSDHVGRKPLIVCGGFLTAAFAYPFWLLVDSKSYPIICIAVSLGYAVLLNSLVFGPAGSFFSEQMPTQVRYTGLVMGREINSVLFSGTAPLIAVLLVHWDGGQPWILAAYMAISGIATALCTLALRETAPRALRRRAIREGRSDGSIAVDVEYAEVSSAPQFDAGSEAAPSGHRIGANPE
jgi:MHS family shikimate/dehydroshikimate transporter-like MFS transporter